MKIQVQTRKLTIMHPVFRDVVLFEAVVRISNINIEFVKSINTVNIHYALKDEKKAD